MARTSPPPGLFLSAAACVSLLAGCSSDRGVPAGSPTLQRGIEGTPASAAPTAATDAPPPPRVSPARFRDSVGADGPGAVELPPEGPPLRDLTDELSRAFGNPTRCFDVEAVRANAPRLDLTVTTHVSVTGRVTRAEVSGGRLDGSVRSCLVTHAETLRFAAPVDRAPRSVSARLRFDLDAPPDPGPDEEPEWRLPAGARAPAVVLPAQVGEGPAPGAQAPGVVLPAQVGKGPPPGSVAPGLVLPARGGSGSSVDIGER